MSKFVVVVECAIEHNDTFLMIERPPGVHAAGLLAFPGGKVEFEDGQNNNDILIEAVKREVLEEVGLQLIDPIQFVISSYFIASDNEHVLDVIFHCELEKTIAKVQASSREVPHFYWLTRSEIEMHQQTPVWLKRYMACIA